MILWDVFVFTILLLDWRLLYKHSRQPAHKQSVEEEGNTFLVSILVIASIFACLIFVFLLLFDQNSNFVNSRFVLGLTLFGIACSWFMLHTIFTLHYIHKYYQLKSKGIKALVFSNEKEEPEYRDFIYFSFIVGCTFQVADFVTNDKSMRQLVLLHCLLSFWLNTFVVALTINLIAGKG
ncbi:hypothetical protein FACS189446_7860 [Bacteroidia bacterium]|nr:hypothetical protein FACS189446_7860 [Bacteroidia bacterium]